MLHEVELKRALQAYLDDQEVRVILPMDEDEERVIPFRKLFNGACFLVDRSPAVINREFDDALREAFPGGAEEASERTQDCTGPDAADANIAGRQKPLDTRMVMALHRTGWTNRKIAYEMRVHESTIDRVIKSEIRKQGGES